MKIHTLLKKSLYFGFSRKIQRRYLQLPTIREYDWSLVIKFVLPWLPDALSSDHIVLLESKMVGSRLTVISMLYYYYPVFKGTCSTTCYIQGTNTTL